MEMLVTQNSQKKVGGPKIRAETINSANRKETEGERNRITRHVITISKSRKESDMVHTLGAEAGGSQWVQGQSGLHSKLQAE